MATLALAAAGAAAGSTLLPTGISFLGATISGATLGAQVGALAGSYVDQALFGSSGEDRVAHGPRLNDLRLLGSQEGAVIPRIYGRARVGGQLIWADAINERTTTRTSSSGSGKGSGGGGGSSTTVTYSYFASFAVALSEGQISSIERIWADNQELNLSRLSYRFYPGTEDQTPDGLIENRLGVGNAPGFRGVAYVVFEGLPLRDYGNRIPQLSFEVIRPVDDYTDKVKSVVLIPGSGEFVYAPEPVNQTFGDGYFAPENVHTLQARSDWSAAIDQLQASFPNLAHVSLVVSWFGTDLRVAHCNLRPGVELDTKTTSPISWSVAGEVRGAAYVVSKREGKPAYGGTPADRTVIDAIVDLKARGLTVTINPFILMDVPAGNTRSNPYDGAGAQPPYPWRGRITIDPAPGQPASPDNTPAAATQIAPFVGTAQVGDFVVNGSSVAYSGPNEWTLRRMVLHYAHLAKAAGGVDAFLLGSELRGLTWARDGAESYPFVTALVQLANDVKAVLGSATKVTYGADWSEFFGHQPDDGSGDVTFHLDPLWSSPDIDAVGIDLYWPLADWRDGFAHTDYAAGTRSVYDSNYLRSNVVSGEGFDWYYASQADRDQQVRTPITDGYGKPWVFRYKDIKAWWANAHYNRPGGVETTTATGWVPQSKPFWFTEVGCPAIDKGANQPNVFTDPKSSENAVPHYSSGVRDDLMQRRYNDAIMSAFDPTDPFYQADANPISTVDGRRMLDTERLYLYAWDARPYPAFPFNTGIWGDGENWYRGHWISGRAAKAPVSEAVRRLMADYSFDDFDADQLQGSIAGYALDRIMSLRDALQPLSLAYFFDVRESDGKIKFVPRARASDLVHLTEDDVVETKPENPLVTIIRQQETDLPASAKIRYLSSRAGLNASVAEARRLTGASGRTAQADLPILLDPDDATEIAETWLHEAWVSRERAKFSLPPSHLALEPGDTVSLPVADGERCFRIKEISGRNARAIEALSVDREIYTDFENTVPGENSAGVTVVTAAADVLFLDLPILRDESQALSGYVAATQTPWPGPLAVYGSPEANGFVLRSQIVAPSIMGTLETELPGGPLAVFDYGSRPRVRLASGTLTSATRLQLFAGQNAAAVQTPDGAWEVFQFETATLVASGVYELSGLLRGQGGTEGAMHAPLAAGARLVMLSDTVTPIALTLDELRLPYYWRTGPAHFDLSDPTFETQSHTFTGDGLKPLSPVHVRGVRSSGDLHLSWIRRTRIGGDNWDAPEVPLGEDEERYDIDILKAGTVVRTLVSLTPFVTYTSADQITDFGTPQSTLEICVYQNSVTYGRGSGMRATV